MEDLPSDVRGFLQNHPFLQVTDAKKIKCTLNGHEFPCNLTQLKHFTEGKKYKKLSENAEFDYKQYEPHLVPSTKQKDNLFCKLTLRHINRLPHHVLRHVNGKRFQKALLKYKECQQQGVEYIPARLQQKKPPRDKAEAEGEWSHGRSKSKGDGEMWEPSSEGDEGSDSEDSMSDLYPSTLFTPKDSKSAEGVDEDEDDFQTDEEEMEVSGMEDESQAGQKRKKMQSGDFKKKFKNNRKRKGFKFVGKINGK